MLRVRRSALYQLFIAIEMVCLLLNLRYLVNAKALCQKKKVALGV
jgi:hypothetical protein